MGKTVQIRRSKIQVCTTVGGKQPVGSTFGILEAIWEAQVSDAARGRVSEVVTGFERRYKHTEGSPLLKSPLLLDTERLVMSQYTGVKSTGVDCKDSTHMMFQRPSIISFGMFENRL